jgi:hypothetical protein
MQGRRWDSIPSDGKQPGDYWKDGSTWWAWVPGTKFIGRLTDHTVTEHDDGTITVLPSILVDESVSKADRWHGYLERGVWREC